MRLELNRRVYLQNATVGELLVDNKFECYILEDPCREVYNPLTGGWDWNRVYKEFGVTAIPSGRYEVVLDHSNRFNRVLPRLVDVPDFTGIRIHNGGKPEHTHGCLLPGKEWVPVGITSAYLTGSKHYAFPRLMDKLQKASSSIEIVINNIVPFDIAGRLKNEDA